MSDEVPGWLPVGADSPVGGWTSPEDRSKWCPACQAGHPWGDENDPRSYIMRIEDGTIAVRCTCGRVVTDVMEVDFWQSDDIPVTVHYEPQCGNLGGWHGLSMCDHGWSYLVTPKAAPLPTEPERGE